MNWIDSIHHNRALIQGAGQTDLAVIVSGSPLDSAFWAREAEAVKTDTLREDGGIAIVSLTEERPLGNFLGTVNAWRQIPPGQRPASGVSLMSMVFGQGKRFSPFTQALGNRKAAFPTPLRGSRSGRYLRTGDLATLYSNSWLEQLRSGGFNGSLIKWGDEAVIPGAVWSTGRNDFSGVDLIRFVWKTEPTETLAREKEWFVIDNETGLIERLIPRQSLETLQEELRGYEGRRYATAVNLGSVAASYHFLNLATEVFSGMLDGSRLADWDPMTMFLLLGGNGTGAAAQAALQAAESRCPGLRETVSGLRGRSERELGRPLRAAFIDFGDALWVDLGLHSTLRKTLETLTQESPAGAAMRAFFDIPAGRDSNGNILVDSAIPAGADIRNSVIIDSTIQDAKSVVHSGVIAGSRHDQIRMPDGGASLFSAIRHLEFAGPRGIVFRTVADRLSIPEGGRHAMLFLDSGAIPMVSLEDMSLDGPNYAEPVPGNAISFQEAGRLAAAMDGGRLEENWRRAWAAATA